MMPAFVLSSPGRKRMAALATSAALYTLVDSGFIVIGPLWATRDLGLDNAAWAFLRSASELGGFVSVLALGILAERLGSRWMSAIALIGAGLVLAALSTGEGAAALMAVLGACVSIIYVSFNTLAQSVSSQRQGLANAIYRASGASAAIVAPTVATQAAEAFGAYGPVLAAASVVLGIAGLAIFAYSEPAGPATRHSFPELLALYRRCFTLAPLLAFIAISRAFAAAVAAVGAFAALRFTRELGLSEPAFGALCSFIAIANLFALLVSGWLMKHLRPSGALAGAWLGCSVAAVALGLTSSLAVAIAAYAVFVPLQALCSVPLSLWSNHIVASNRDKPLSQNAVFTVQKLFQSGATMLVMALLGVLEPHVGMGTLMWCSGLLGVPVAAAAMHLGAAQKT